LDDLKTLGSTLKLNRVAVVGLMALHRLGFQFAPMVHFAARRDSIRYSQECLPRDRRRLVDAWQRRWATALNARREFGGSGSALLTECAARVSLPSSAHTAALGRLLAAYACRGDVICLRGDLGAGKTSLARAYVRAVRNDPYLDVTSPTYTLVNSYPAAVPQSGEDSDEFNGEAVDRDCSDVPDIYHMDLWRLRDAAERNIVDFGYVFAEHIALIEWPDRLGTLTPASRLDVWFQLEVDSKAQTESLCSKADESADFWQFREDDDESDNELASGRAAVLVAHGERWQGRVKALLTSDGKFSHQPLEREVPHLRFSLQQDSAL
jgi:tRNA threonylcarbamoyladenosine biosynthesis protein TsaE